MNELTKTPSGTGRDRWLKRAGRGCAGLALAGLLLAQSPPAPDPPNRLEIVPNAIQRLDTEMKIFVDGIPQGGHVHLQVLQDCTGDGVPDLYDMEDCRSPLYQRSSEPANEQGAIEDGLHFERLKKEGTALPRNKVLWLRASRPGSPHGRQILFGLVDDPCTLWTTVVATFLGGECDPHLAQALLQHRSDSKLTDVTFEVRLLDVESPAGEQGVAPRPVPRTLGATGLTWLDDDHLIFTVAETVRPEPGGFAAETEPPRPAEPGLYRIFRDGTRRERLWAPTEGDRWRPVAPLALADGRIAFVRQPLGEPAAGEPPARLHVWSAGRLGTGIPLPYKVHQLVAADASGTSVLALTLGRQDSRPAFMTVDPEEGTWEYLGFHRGLYHAAMRSPQGGQAAIAIQDVTSQIGWFLVLVDGQGQLLKDLQVRPDVEDLMPAWSRDGRWIAYLAEVGRVTLHQRQ